MGEKDGQNGIKQYGLKEKQSLGRHQNFLACTPKERGLNSNLGGNANPYIMAASLEAHRRATGSHALAA